MIDIKNIDSIRKHTIKQKHSKESIEYIKRFEKIHKDFENLILEYVNNGEYSGDIYFPEFYYKEFKTTILDVIANYKIYGYEIIDKGIYEDYHGFHIIWVNE